jgi:hypothetical protein
MATSSGGQLVIWIPPHLPLILLWLGWLWLQLARAPLQRLAGEAGFQLNQIPIGQVAAIDPEANGREGDSFLERIFSHRLHQRDRELIAASLLSRLDEGRHRWRHPTFDERQIADVLQVDPQQFGRDLAGSITEFRFVMISRDQQHGFHAVDRQVLVGLQFKAGSFVQAGDEGEFPQHEQKCLWIRLEDRGFFDIIVLGGFDCLIDIGFTNPGPVDDRADKQDSFVAFFQFAQSRRHVDHSVARLTFRESSDAGEYRGSKFLAGDMLQGIWIGQDRGVALIRRRLEINELAFDSLLSGDAQGRNHPLAGINGDVAEDSFFFRFFF